MVRTTANHHGQLASQTHKNVTVSLFLIRVNVEGNILFLLKVESGAVLPLPRCVCATTRVKEATQIDAQLKPYFPLNNYASATCLTMKYTPFEYLK